jgi:putative glutamine amidotransferase
MISPEEKVSSILVTCGDKARLQKHYIPALRSAGWDQELGLLSPGDPVPSLDCFSGLLMVGGNDIHPRYWEPVEVLHPTAEVDAGRDALEIPLAREAWRLGLPILGICRGEQVLNVALGGSLIQDIPSHFGCPPENHGCGDSDTPLLCHRVTLDPASRLAGLLGCEAFPVNSRHHQAVGRVAPALLAVGWHPETTRNGAPLIEAIEARDSERWAVGVQWHPENLVALDNEAGLVARRIFGAFVAAVRLQQSLH